MTTDVNRVQGTYKIQNANGTDVFVVDTTGSTISVNGNLSITGIFSASNIGGVVSSSSYATTSGYALSFNTATLVANAVRATTASYATTSGYALSFNTATLVAQSVLAQSLGSGIITISNPTSSTNYSNGALIVTGGVGISNGLNVFGNTNITGNLNVTGNISGTNIVVTVNQVTASSGVFYGDPTGSGALYAGIATYTPFTQTMFQASGNYNGYMEINVQNVNPGVKNSTDIVASADDVGINNSFIDMGITGSNWDGSQPYSFGTVLLPNDGYILVGPNAVNNRGSLVLGTTTTGTNIKFVVAAINAQSTLTQVTSSSVVMSVNPVNTPATSTATGALVVTGGMGISGSIYAGGVITATNLYVGSYPVSTGSGISSIAAQLNGSSIGSFNTINFATGTTATITGSVITVQVTASGGSGKSTSSATPPVGPAVGDIWYNTSTDDIYRYTTDGTSTYWLDITGPSFASSQMLGTYAGTLTVTGAATISGPVSISSATTITGSLTVSGPLTVAGVTTLASYGSVLALFEQATITTSSITTVTNFDIITQPVQYYTTATTSSWTLNLRGNSSTTFNSIVSTGQVATFVLMVTNTATAYYQTGFQIDGVAVTPKWSGGTAPTMGNSSATDVYSFSVLKISSSTYTVLATQSKFA